MTLTYSSNMRPRAELKIKPKRLNFSYLGALVLCLFALQAHAISPAALQQGVPSLAPMLELATPAVVNIRVAKMMPTAGRFFFNEQEVPDELRQYLEQMPGRGGQEQRPYATGAGSGVIIDESNGYIVTNHHVIEGANQISVQLADGRTFEAELLGSDPDTDIALLQIEADQLMDIDLADIDSVQVGDYVVAIGNPFGIGQTVTAGIVSALGRTGLNNEHYEDFIQTDAAINMGNSGGALIDMEGRLIGINSAIISDSGGSNGIGFAVPVDMVAAVIGHLQRDGEVRRGMLGVSITDINTGVAEALALDVQRGALVTSVLPESAAEQAGIQVSDVIVQVDDQEVDSGRDLRNIVGLKSRGQQVKLALYRDGKRLDLDAVIGGAEGIASVTRGQSSPSDEFRGAQLRSLPAGGDAFAESGVQVTELSDQSRAWAAGLRAGDVIIEVNRQPIADLTNFNAAVAGAEQGFAALTVLREGRRLLLLIS